MKSFKRYLVICVTVILTISMAGCQFSGGRKKSAGADSSKNGSNSVEASSIESQANEPSSEKSSNEPSSVEVDTITPVVEWGTKTYEDEYLKYQIPDNWEQNTDFSDAANRLTLFTSSEPASKNPSNVNVQITSIKSQGKDMNYGDPEVQNDFHHFLTTEAGLPEEAKDGIFTVYQTKDFYVYSISFTRTVEDGTKVKQTAYIPVGLDYAIMIWATDWNDSASPSVEEFARHICATLEIKHKGE